jgi:hypothetical protein
MTNPVSYIAVFVLLAGLGAASSGAKAAQCHGSVCSLQAGDGQSKTLKVGNHDHWRSIRKRVYLHMRHSR